MASWACLEPDSSAKLITKTMLSLLEVVGGIFWAWLPVLGINEIPSTNTIVGGVVICLAIAMNSYRFDKKRLQNLIR